MAQASILENDALTAFAARYEAHFGQAPLCFFAPGRINLIGEHTDYSGGLCMPGAIREGVLVGAARAHGRIRIVSETLGAKADVGWPPAGPRGDWTDYVVGVALELRKAGASIEGAELLIASDLPMGAGVSSSAALEVAAAMALAALAEASFSPLEIAKIAQRAENTFVGAPCGLMDQFASACSPGGLVVLDCQTLSQTALTWPGDWGLLLIDSGVKHAIVDGGYGERRAEIEAAAAQFGGEILRDVAEKLTPGAIARLPEPLRRRARHVVRENARVEEAGGLLLGAVETPSAAWDFAAELGRLLFASHASLRDDLDATCPETDDLALIAQRTDGVFGARQMGGGFGGNVLALCDVAQMGSAMSAILDRYEAKTGKRTTAFPVVLGPGARQAFP